MSAGRLKLEKALNQFGLSVEGKIAIDITLARWLLQMPAAKMEPARLLVDVGTNQLAWHAMTLGQSRMEQFTSPAEPADLSDTELCEYRCQLYFLRLDSGQPFTGFLADNGQVVALVKPQFEVGRELIGKNGIIKDPKIHFAVLEKVAAFATWLQVMGGLFLSGRRPAA